MASGKEEQKGKLPSVYRLHLKPNEEQRREQWNLILVSDIEVTVDFFHTDLLEKVISITEVKEETEKKLGEEIVG